MNDRTAATMSLGFLFLAVPEWLTSAAGAGWYPLHTPSMMVAAWLAFGVVGLFIVGILAIRADNALDATLFLGWAPFFLGWLLTYLWAPGVHAETVGLQAWFVLFWGVFALFLWLAALGGGIARSLFLFTQWVALILIAASMWAAAPMVAVVGHYVAMFSALTALYQAVGSIVNFAQGRVLLHGCGFVEEEEI